MLISKFQADSLTIGQLLELVIDQQPNLLALDCPSENLRIEYTHFSDRVRQVAGALVALGVEKGDRVAIWADNVSAWPMVQLGAALIGAVLVPVDCHFRLYELTHVLEAAGVSVLVVDGRPEVDGILSELCPNGPQRRNGQPLNCNLPNLRHLVCTDDTQGPGNGLGWSMFLDGAHTVSDSVLTGRQQVVSADETAVLAFTAGTTGLPKAVMLSHTNLLDTAWVMAHGMGLTPDDTLCVPVPFYSGHGYLMGILACLSAGATLAPAARFSPKSAMAVVQDTAASALHATPRMFADICDYLGKKGPPGRLRTGILAGGPCSVELMKQISHRLGMSDVCVAYGQAEASHAITLTRKNDPLTVRVSSVGRALNGTELAVFEPGTGALMDPGNQGELCVRGRNVMVGYYQDLSGTASAIDSGGWLHTGDLATMDETGNCRIVGRLTDLIQAGEDRINPREIEAFLYRHPGVRDAQVVGVPGTEPGMEVPVAFICPKAGASLESEEIIDFCESGLSEKKQPVHVMFVEAFPTAASGKVLKYKLRDEAARAVTAAR